jgi:hypothetical protein
MVINARDPRQEICPKKKKKKKTLVLTNVGKRAAGGGVVHTRRIQNHQFRVFEN